MKFQMHGFSGKGTAGQLDPSGHRDDPKNEKFKWTKESVNHRAYRNVKIALIPWFRRP